VSVCGEIAAQPEFIPKLLEMGFNHFSVSPRLIPLARVGARKFLRMQKASELGKT
jgi:phosphoenolpyruvate-protein kinase (PTS system EI component)